MSSVSLASRTVKYVLLLLLALNARSFPGMWHIRVLFHSQWVWHLKRKLHGSRHSYIRSLAPIGRSPFSLLHTMSGLATLDDSDMFGHLSNSSYAKTLDIVRLQSAVDFFPSWYAGLNGTHPLAGADYAFLREIPVLARYEMRTAIGGWDHKWLYLVTYFVSYPQKGSKTTKKTDERLLPPAPLPSALLPEGAILHSVAVSRLCFKQGRLTVPPCIVLSLQGLGGSEPIGRARWARKEQLLQQGKLKEILRKGEWKDELARSSEEGGWALGELEGERKRGRHMCGGLLSALEDLRPVAEE